MKQHLPEEEKLREDSQDPCAAEGGDAAKRRRRICLYCLAFAIWLLVGIGLLAKTMTISDEPAEEKGEVTIWRFVNNEE